MKEKLKWKIQTMKAFKCNNHRKWQYQSNNKNKDEVWEFKEVDVK